LFIKLLTKAKIVYYYSKSLEASIKLNTSFIVATKRMKKFYMTSKARRSDRLKVKPLLQPWRWLYLHWN